MSTASIMSYGMHFSKCNKYSYYVLDYVDELLQKLETCITNNKKMTQLVQQPATLYSTAPQEERNATIDKCNISSRGVRRKE